MKSNTKAPAFDLVAFGGEWGKAYKAFRSGAASIGAATRTALGAGLPALSLIAASLTVETASKAGEKPDHERRNAGRIAARMVRRELDAHNAQQRKAAGVGGKWIAFEMSSRKGVLSVAAVRMVNPTAEEAAAQKAAAQASATDGEQQHAALVEKGADALASEVLALREQVATLTAERDAARAEVAALKGATPAKGRATAPAKAAA